MVGGGGRKRWKLWWLWEKGMDWCTFAGFADGGRRLWYKECGHPPGAGNGKTKQNKQILSQSHQKRVQPCQHFILAQCDPCQTSDLLNCKIINLKCLKPLSFQQLVKVSTEN